MLLTSSAAEADSVCYFSISLHVPDFSAIRPAAQADNQKRRSGEVCIQTARCDEALLLLKAQQRLEGVDSLPQSSCRAAGRSVKIHLSRDVLTTRAALRLLTSWWRSGALLS